MFAFINGIIQAVRALGLVRVGVVYAVMSHGMEWGTDIINTGQTIGAAVSGESPASLTPSGIYSTGLSLIDAIYDARAWGMWFHPIQDLALLSVTIITQMTWLATASIYLWALIESVYAVAINPILVCFAPLEYTFPMLVTWGQRLLALCTKIIALLLVLAVGMALAADWSNYLNVLGHGINDHRVYYATVTLVESLVFLSAVWWLPNEGAG